MPGGLAGAEALAAGDAAGLPPGVLLPGIQIEDSIYSLGGGRYLVVAVGSRRGADDRVLARARVAQLVAAAPGGEVVFVPGGWWRWGW